MDLNIRKLILVFDNSVHQPQYWNLTALSLQGASHALLITETKKPVMNNAEVESRARPVTRTGGRNRPRER